MSEVTEALQRDGYAVVRGFVGADDVQRLRDGFDRLLALARTLEGTQPVDGARFVVKHDPFRLHRVVWCGAADDALASFGSDPRFLRLAAEVLGQRQLVQLIQQAHYKLPGDGVDFAWHQDASNRRYGTEFVDVLGDGSFVQMALAVDAMTPDNGPLRMIPGTHRLGFVADPRTGVVPQRYLQLERAVDVDLAPGDLAVFGPFVLHGSPPNRSDRPRRLFLQGYTVPGANRRVYPGAGTGVPRWAPKPS